MYKQANGRRYWVTSEGEGPSIVFLHGFTGTHHSFDEIVPFLSERFKIIRIDLPGHGRTGSIGVVSMEECCSDIMEILTGLNVLNCSMYGYSLGGRTALSFAMLFPEVVDRLILESASPGLKTVKERMERCKKDERLATQLMEKGLVDFVNTWERIPLFQSQEQLPSEVRERIRQGRLSQDPRGLCESLEGMGTGAQPSWWDKLSTYHGPVCLLTGEWDHKFKGLNKQMNSLLPNSTWIEAPKTGHAVHVEAPRFIPEIVERFMVQ